MLGFAIFAALLSLWGSWQVSSSREEQARAEEVRRATLAAEQRVKEDKQRAEAKAAADKDKAAEAAAFEKALAVAQAVKRSATDPETVEFIEALVTDDGTTALKFRAKDSFGALVVDYAILTKDGKTTSGPEETTAPFWNQYVAKRHARDVTKPIRGAASLGVI